MRITILIYLLLFNIYSYAQGITFFTGTYSEAKIIARKDKKKIFVDAYTTWCGPCKKMVKEAFSNPEVGRYFDQNFVALQIDAENEADSDFFKDYTATAFPSLFWLDSNGDLMDKHIGFLDATGFLKATKMASEKNLMDNFKTLKNQWETEDRDFDLFQKYSVIANKVKPELRRSIAEEYLLGLTPEELLTSQTFSILQSFVRKPEDNVFFNMLIKNWDHYMMNSENQEEDWSRLYSGLVRLASIYRNDKKIELYNQQIELINNLDFKHKELFIESIQLENLIFSKNYSEAIDRMIQLTEKYPDKHFLYDNYYYTLILSDYFVKEDINLEEAEKLIAFTRKNAKFKATQKSMLYLASAYAYKKDYKTAYEYLASLGFYPKPMLSNALYPKLNLPVPRDEFPWD